MRIAAAVIAGALAGCGLTMTHGPAPNRPTDERPRCTETFDAPKRDAIGAILGLVAAVFGGVALDAADNDEVGVPLLVGGLVVMGGSYLSGGVGYYRVKRCRAAISEFERRGARP